MEYGTANNTILINNPRQGLYNHIVQGSLAVLLVIKDFRER